ncbi:hypothetical protein GIB67_020583 [Kingdonia uniflora]|uniref:Protein kinase domain-containing protein n=1 Tax=Kingdonia uniflora TaxID=39325 RepID=A0A7J7NVW5_9MAGN|nr:hypothetical protein GIB67_020583 [Kingdonia uniflora]
MYAQLYIYNPSATLDTRHKRNPRLNRNVLQTIENTVQQNNLFCELYQRAFEVLEAAAGGDKIFNVPAYLHYDNSTNHRRYNMPTTDEIAVILPGDGMEINNFRDIIVYQCGHERVTSQGPNSNETHNPNVTGDLRCIGSTRRKVYGLIVSSLKKHSKEGGHERNVSRPFTNYRHYFQIGLCTLQYISNLRTFFIHDENNELSLDNIIAASNAGASTTAATNQLLVISENQIIGWEQLNEISIGTAKGIAYLHKEYFGLAKLCNRDSSHMIMAGCKGTLGYAVLELWMPYPVTHKCDIYNFEILLFEIIGRRRHHDDSLNQSQEWLPRWVWEKFEKRELDDMMELYGIGEKNIENVNGCFVVCSVLTRGKTSNVNCCKDVGRKT